MIRTRPSLLRASAVALVLGLGACSKAPRPEPVSTVAAPVNPIEEAVTRLDKGDEAGARKALAPLLAREPANPEANVLLASIEQDPVALLGPKSFAYTAAPGDTMLGLSERFLGNRLKFYQLSRYNGLKVPAELAPGTQLKIPGEAPHAAAPEPARAAPKSSPRHTKAQAAPAPSTPAAPRAPASDPAAALRLRGAALSALNQGKADQAVALLRRAAGLAPGNALVARDLARAERIASTVHQRR